METEELAKRISEAFDNQDNLFLQHWNSKYYFNDVDGFHYIKIHESDFNIENILFTLEEEIVSAIADNNKEGINEYVYLKAVLVNAFRKDIIKDLIQNL